MFLFSQEIWLGLLSTVNGNLGVKGSMELNPDLVTFLEKKSKSGNQKDQFTILEIFDCVIEKIKEKYHEMLEERDSRQEEFDMENIASGISTEDGLFFINFFLPSSILYMYQLFLESNLDMEVICNELFTIGAGSETWDFSPEINGICQKCAGDQFVGLKMKTHDEIRQINIGVFKQQKKNKFVKPGPLNRADVYDDESSALVGNPFVDSDDGSINKSDDSSGVKHANPFVDSEEDSDEEILLDSCDICCQSFPTPEFVALHRHIFHSHVIKTKFIDSPECLMTSFIAPVSKPPVVDSEPTSDGLKENLEQETNGHGDSSEATGNRSKYNFRKRLKM